MARRYYYKLFSVYTVDGFERRYVKDVSGTFYLEYKETWDRFNNKHFQYTDIVKELPDNTERFRIE